MNKSNWDARPKGSNYWQRSWVKEIYSYEMPKDVICCRAYDLAATERSQANKNPDPTACGKLYRSKDNNIIYLAGEYHNDFYDNDFEIYGQFCKRAGDRDAHILKQAEHDGDDCIIVLPVDAGASGKQSFESMAANLMSHGFIVKPDPMPNNKSKLTRFIPFATACENGLVYVLVDTFDKKTLEFIYKQLEAFDGTRSTSTRHDEFPDLFASGFNFISTTRVYRPVSIPVFTHSETKLAEMKRSLR